MDTYLKLTSVKNNKNCNCISPFYINGITGINPNTGREYSNEDFDAMKTALYRISAAKGCSVAACCDPNDPTSMPDAEFTKEFKRKFPKIMPMYEGSQLKYIKLSTTASVKESGWLDPSPYFICKITKATINDTSDSTIKTATGLVNDCFTDSCSATENITVNNLLQNAKADMNYTYIDDARVSQAILDGNMSYVKEYIRKYKQIDIPLTNDDYRNRMVHIAAGSSKNDILTMLIALKANLNITNKLNETPLHHAVRTKNLDNISSLLTQGVDMTIPTNKGETAMFYAMATGDMRIINMLYTNNSPVLGVDKQGNNLIHYCIMYCPSYKEDDDTVPNTKSEVIQWLIDHGISTEQKNTKGITPLELVSREINKELDTECNKRIENDKNDVIEKFFGGSNTPKNIQLKKPYLQKYKTNNKVEGFSSDNVSSQDLSSYTSEHLSLLDIQTKIFNNILRNNPDKYGDYISVADIPKGAPIQVLDTVCVGGSGITGNEDSDECLTKGGQLVKVKNMTTKVKLELLPDEETVLDQVDEKNLYQNKIPSRIPKGTVPQNVANYNASVKRHGNMDQLTPKTTAGITYPIAAGSDNTIEQQSMLTTPSATIAANISTIPTITYNESNSKKTLDEHPSILDENDQIVRKCKRDAMRNSEKIQATTTTQISQMPIPTTTNQAVNYMKIIQNYKNTIYTIIILCLVIILLIVAYHWYVSS